jgi:hypothetical protein
MKVTLKTNLSNEIHPTELVGLMVYYKESTSPIGNVVDAYVLHNILRINILYQGSIYIDTAVITISDKVRSIPHIKVS